MKKGKVFGKSQIVVAVMLLALGGAIWLNMKYTPSSGKYLGEASYVSGKNSVSAVETSAKAEKATGDYFTEVKKPAPRPMRRRNRPTLPGTSRKRKHLPGPPPSCPKPTPTSTAPAMRPTSSARTTLPRTPALPIPAPTSGSRPTPPSTALSCATRRTGRPSPGWCSSHGTGGMWGWKTPWPSVPAA